MAFYERSSEDSLLVECKNSRGSMVRECYFFSEDVVGFIIEKILVDSDVDHRILMFLQAAEESCGAGVVRRLNFYRVKCALRQKDKGMLKKLVVLSGGCGKGYEFIDDF